MKRAVITSMGIVSPIGSGRAEFNESIETGFSGTDYIVNYDSSSFPVRLGAEARKNGQVILTGEEIDRRDLFSREALAELMKSRCMERYHEKDRMFVAGSGIDYFRLSAYAESDDAKRGSWQGYSMKAVRAFARYANEFGIHGGTFSNVSACVASSQAIGHAFRIIASGAEKGIIAGGVDSMLNPLHYMGFYKLGALSDWGDDPKKSCRPFDRDRRGVVLGEGAVYYFIEDIDRARDAEILAEIAGYSSTIDSYLVTDPEPGGTMLAKAACDAIAQAGLSPSDIDCVHAHGTSTVKNDIAECNAMKKIFGDAYRDVPVFSLKGQVGHLIGACGACEIAAVIWSLENQQVPATVNFEIPDPGIDLLVLKQPRSTRIRNILKLNAAFGGQNTALVFRKV
jgi:3-oxoacyl-[acyl-carrier-protein] synthase II